MSLISSFASGVADVASRDTGHALNLGSNLLTNGSIHGAGNPLGTGLVNYAHSNSSNPSVLLNTSNWGQSGGGSNGGGGGNNGQVLGAQTSGDTSVLGGGNGSGGTGGSGGGGANYSQQIASLNNLLGAADQTQANGTQAINTSYNNGLAGLNQSQSNVLSGYATQGQDAKNNYGNSLQQINSNAHNGYQSLMRLLGGTGSAGTVLAPFAVSQQANQQRQGAQTNYAKNSRDLSSATDQAVQDYQNKLSSLNSSKNSQMQSLLNSISSSKQNYKNQIAQYQSGAAQAGTMQQINDLVNQQAQLGQQYAAPQLSVAPVTAKPVSLDQYQAQAAQLAGGSTDPASQQVDAAASLAALQKQDPTQQNQYSY